MENLYFKAQLNMSLYDSEAKLFEFYCSELNSITYRNAHTGLSLAMEDEPQIYNREKEANASINTSICSKNNCDESRIPKESTE